MNFKGGGRRGRLEKLYLKRGHQRKKTTWVKKNLDQGEVPVRSWLFEGKRR